MVKEEYGSKLFIVTKWLLPGPERACSLASGERDYNYVLKKESKVLNKSDLCDQNLLYSSSGEIKNGTKVAKVLGNEVMVKTCSEFKVPQYLWESRNFKIPEASPAPKWNGLKSQQNLSPDLNEGKDAVGLKTAEAGKKANKRKNSEQKKAPESFLRTLKRRSLRVARSKSWVCTEKRKSGKLLSDEVFGANESKVYSCTLGTH